MLACRGTLHPPSALTRLQVWTEDGQPVQRLELGDR